MRDTEPNDGSQSWLSSLAPWQRLVLSVACIGVGVGGVYLKHHPESLSTTVWSLLFIAFGLYVAYVVVSNVRRGRAGVDPYGFGDNALMPPYVRSEEPEAFWMVVAAKAAFGGFCIVAGLGQLLGFWRGS